MMCHRSFRPVHIARRLGRYHRGLANSLFIKILLDSLPNVRELTGSLVLIDLAKFCFPPRYSGASLFPFFYRRAATFPFFRQFFDSS